MLIFFIAHVYLATAGHTATSHIKAMITGWEEVEDLDTVEDWEVKKKATRAGHKGLAFHFILLTF